MNNQIQNSQSRSIQQLSGEPNAQGLQDFLWCPDGHVQSNPMLTEAGHLPESPQELVGEKTSYTWTTNNRNEEFLH